MGTPETYTVVKKPVGKIRSAGCSKIILTRRKKSSSPTRIFHIREGLNFLQQQSQKEFFNSLLGQTGLGRFRHLSEKALLPHCQVGQDLTIQLDAGQSQTAHETAIGKAVLSGSRIDADDPQSAEVPFALLAVTVGVTKAPLHGLPRSSVQPTASTAIAFGHLQIFLVPLVSSLSSLNSHPDFLRDNPTNRVLAD
jgi:hypothetical protein